MRASLETFAKIKMSGKIAVLGEMRELGENAAEFHAELEPLLENIEHVILVGNIWNKAMKNHEYIFAEKWQDALEVLKKIMNESEWHGILVKGSNSIGLGNIVKELSE